MFPSPPSRAPAGAPGGHEPPRAGQDHDATAPWAAIQALLAALEALGIVGIYGSACVFMASLCREVLNDLGIDARIAWCCLEADPGPSDPEGPFLLGHRDFGEPGQLRLHAVCIVGEALVVDTGLGVLRRHLGEHLPSSALAVLRPCGDTLASLALPGGMRLAWHRDGYSLDGAQAELEAQSATVRTLAGFVSARVRTILARDAGAIIDGVS